MTDQQFPESLGAPLAHILDPRAGGPDQGPMITAKFFLGMDPRKDSVGQSIVDGDGNIPNIEMVSITNLNDPHNSPMIVKSTDIHRYQRFPREYAAFKQGLDMQTTGIPLREWLGNNDRTDKLASFHIHTVEQLAGASDTLCQTLGPGTQDLRRRAQTHLLVHKDSAAAERAVAENQALKRQIDDMQANMAKLMTIVEAGQAREGASQPLQEHPAEIEPSDEPKRRGPKPGWKSAKENLRDALHEQTGIST